MSGSPNHQAHHHAFVQDIFEVVQRAVHDANEEVQVESPLGSHDEL